MPRRGRGAELSALREKKKKEQTGAKTTKPQSSVSQNTNRDGGGRTGGLTRQEVAKKVQNAPGYSNGSTIKAYQEKYPTSQKSSVSQTNRSNRSNSSITQNATHRSRNSGAVERGREQTPINRGQTYATAAEMRRAREDEQLKRNPSPTAKEMLAKRQDQEDARKRRINERRARDEEARTRMDKAVQGMSRRQEKTKDLAEESKTDSTAERVVRNTGRAASKGFKDAVSGTAQAALDIEEMNYSHKRPGRGAGLQATREYQETKGRESDIQEAIRRRNAKDEMRSKRLGLAEKQEERQQEWDEQTKNIGKAEKAWYGAVESGVGMATDMAIGAATGTGQTGALLSMFGRTYGTTRGQAEKEGATESEDRLNAMLQASKETATELMFPGWGLAKGYAGKAGLKAGEKLANALTRNMRGKAADITYAGLRALGGTVEENLEEVAGWGLDPFIKEIAYGRNVRNRAKAQLLADMPAITSREEAESLNARLNSGSFVEELAAEYIANGMPEKKARELAEKMRDFYSAYYAGDDEAIEELGDDLAGELTGAKRISKESFSRSELLDTLASTTMLTAVTGIPGAVTTAQRGAELKTMLGADGLKSLAKQVLNSEDAEASARGKVAQAALDAGKEITSTQVFDLEQSLYQQQEKDVKRQNAQLDTAGKQIRDNKYVTPFAMDDRGRIVHMEDATIDAYNEAANSAESAIKDVDTKNSLTDTDVMYGARAIAGFKTGAFTIDDANTIVADEAVKQAFEEQTGIDLSQYEVKNKDGSINIPKTNAAIKDALFAMAADNLVQMAEVETANWMDTARGETVRQVTARMGAKGGVAVQLALDDMDERDANTYRNMAVASDYVYQSALNIGVPWEDAKDAITSQFSSIPESKLQMLYEAGLADRQASTDNMLGLQAKIGEAMSKDSEKAEDPTKGQCLIETKQTPKNSIIRVFTDIADNLGINIHLVDDLPVDKEGTRQANGQYIDGEIYINVNSTFEENLGYIFMHEVTHHLKKYAPEQYKALENLVREEWFKYNPDQMQSKIAETIKAYEKATKGKQVLTEEEALEEIIADATHEFLMDKNFAKQVADTEPSLAKAVLDSIKEMLRRLRQIFSSGKYKDSRTYMNSFFSQIGILDEAEKLWLDAYTEAVKNKAAVGIVEWQAEANKQSEVRNSISPEYTQEEMDAHRQTLINEMTEFYNTPYTDNYDEAGFVFPNGKMLKMGEEMRGEDHAIAGIAYDDLDGLDDYDYREEALNRFINEGNFRWQPESQWLDLGASIEPTSEQYEWLRNVVQDQGIFILEFTDAEGNSVESKEYSLSDEAYRNADVVVNDVKRFYKTGSMDGGSQTAMFRYSIAPEIRADIEEKGVDITESGTAVKYSLTSWNDTDKEALLNNLVDAGFDKKIAEKWISDVDSVAANIYGDLARLNYEADRHQDALKPNSEYFYTLDLSTLCQKRRLYQGTYNAIMHRLVNIALQPKDTVRLREMMEEMDLETPCGICYEESRKKNEGKFADTWLNGETDSQFNQRMKNYQKTLENYKKKVADYEKLSEEEKAKKKAPKEPTPPERWMGYANMEHDDPYVPTLADVTTTDGRAKLREEHPDVLEAYLDYQKGRGSANPKVSFTHTDYRGDILRMTKTDVDNVKHIGGLRIQSFSDFETVHVIDMMQAIMDMASMKLTSQAYTKVPAFADIFGGTGIKINLSLIQKMDENGNPVYEEYIDEETGEKKKRLVFDSKEGIDPEEAFRLREKYPENVGTILVGVSEEQIRAAWDDPRVDMVIPFHRSGWAKDEFERLGLVGYEDFQEFQSERHWDEKEKKWISLKDAKMEELYSIDYWDKNLSGKENAKKYLKKCAELHRRPVFYNFLTDNGDGTWSLPEDGTADGYWKSLIDFKMYDNKGKFAPQQEVKPVFDMEAAQKAMDAYEGNADTLPVNNDVVEAYLKDFKKRHPRAKLNLDGDVRLSIAVDLDDQYMSAVNSGNMEEAQRLVDQAAKESGLNSPLLYHGTYEQFTTFKGNEYLSEANGLPQIKGYFSEDRDVSEIYGDVSQYYVGINNPLDFYDVPWSQTESEWRKWFESKGITDIKFDSSIYNDTLKEHINDRGENEYSVFEIFDGVDLWAGDGNLTERIAAAGYDGMRWDYDEKAWMPFNANAIKSADTITYAEDGSVIPLSERFDPNNNDIRYSLPTQDSDGNILTDGQMEYFKNSQARDEQGRLVPVYHTTNKGGFTIFDPERSDDHRSLFFAEDWDTSQTYGNYANSRFYYFDIDNIDDVKKYLDAYSPDRYFVTQEQFDQAGGWEADMLDFENVTNGEQSDFAKYLDNPDGYIAIIGVPDYSPDNTSYADTWIMAKSPDELVRELHNHFGWQRANYQMGTQHGYYACYLNLEDPYIIDAHGDNWNEIHLDDYDDDVTFNTREIAEIAMDMDFDGVIIRNLVDHGGKSPYDGMFDYSDIYIAFSSNQVKDVGNENPTENPDIRYSVTPEDDVMEWLASQWDLDDVPLEDQQAEEGRIRLAKSKKEFIKSKNKLWNERWLTEGKVLDKSAETHIRNLVKGVMMNSRVDKEYKQALVDKTFIAAKSAFWLMKDGKYSEASNIIYDAAKNIVDNADYIEDTQYNMYQNLREYLRNTPFKLGEEYWSDADYNALRKKNRGRIKLVKGETNIDELYQELQKNWPEWFDEDEAEQMTLADQLLRIDYVLDTIQPYRTAYSSEEAAELIDQTANDLYDIVYEGKEYKSIADTYKEKYDAKTKAMRERHEEAIRKAKENSEKKFNNQKNKFKEYKAKEKRGKEKAKHFGHIQDNIDWLTDRLVKETKDKNIPEGFRKSLAHMLMQFDMQTNRSKKLEEKYGPAKKTLKLRELRRKLEDICKEDESGEFAYNGYLFYLMDALADKVEGKTVDSLDVDDLIVIDTMLKAIKHNFANYNKVWKEGKQAEIASFGEKTIEVMDERIAKYGKRKTYAGARGIMDKLLNEGEETPVYFFGRIDPNNEGIGAMYQELSRGEDRHIRNMDFLRKRFQAICGDYFNKKKPGSVLESWRDDSQAQTFNLNNGSVTLNPAQIMSLYCLSKREQAMGHILGAGIVASPVTTGAKMKDAIKGKDEQVQSVMITYDEIQTIIATLTKDQMKMADELQSLMNNEMAAWGNETSLKMHGIKLFREHDYFPIKSSNEVLPKSADNIEVTERIKNFGFTKPLERNANNAIMIDDIFSVTADHCNKMSLYNAFAIPISDFMRVYNYKHTDEDGSVTTVQQAIGEAFTRKANAYIMKFIGDVNGNTKTKAGDAVEGLLNKTLANYKKAAIGANPRVALQQPTAIFRALMEVDAKYFAGVVPTPSAVREMREHCPKALWKSWGHYDVDMGRDMEDIMMNNDWSRMDTVTMSVYGALDDMTWSVIWQAVKKEVKAKNPNLEVGTPEYWEAVNTRAKEVFDKTQVVDSIFNRSDTMRSKSTLTKMMTSFMAEPTLTYNVLRDSLVNAHEMWKDGNITGAMSSVTKMVLVLGLNAAAVSAAAAIWDAVRGKGDDDDDKDWGEVWLMNFYENFKDNANPVKLLPVVKDIWDGLESKLTGSYRSQNNMAMEAFETIATGLGQMKKKLTEGSDKSWYDIMMNVLGGLGYLTGVPAKTIMRDVKALSQKLGFDVFAADGTEEDKSVAEGIMNKLGYRKIDRGLTLPGIKDGSNLDNALNKAGLNLTPAEKELRQMYRKAEEISIKHSDLSGEEKDMAVWKDVTKYMKESGKEKSFSDLVAEGDYTEIRKYRKIYEEAGGDLEYFDGRMFDESKKALKKSIAFNTTDQQYDAQQRMLHYLETHGMSQEEISSEIVYKSDVARDMKVAMRIGDMDLMQEAAKPLAEAGLTYTDLERLWDNRNRVDLVKYKKSNGRYADKLKSMGTFIWPTEGVVTSHFGYRNAPTAGASSNHPAIDIGASTGTPVVAADGGVVIYADSNGGYGNSVGIKHDNGMVTYYNHLYSWNVKVGDTVAQGQQIAQVGSTGISTGPHLDFKILDKNGKPVDPEKYLS